MSDPMHPPGPAAGGRPIGVGRTSSIPDQLGGHSWDDAVPPRLVGMQRRFLQPFLEGKVHGVRSDLLTVPDGSGRSISATVVSEISLGLEVIAPPAIQGWVERRRARWPGFLRMHVLMFGLPASLADHETVFAPGLPEAARALARRELSRESLEMLALSGCDACIWKEFDAQGRAEWGPGLEALGFRWYPSLPLLEQEVTWRDLDDYRGRLRSGYRRQLEANLERAREAGLQIESDLAFAGRHTEFHPLYLQVLERSSTRLEQLTPEFFEALALEPQVRYIRATLEGRLVGAALCHVLEAEQLVFLYVGMDYAVHREVDLYFNLLAAIADLAGRRGVKRIRWGQTSEDAKGRMGAVTTPLWFAIRFRRRLLDPMVSLAGRWLFPVREQIPRRVMR